MNYSVLMPVYCKEKPDYLRRSIDSVMAQSVLPNDFVIVCDGPLTSELDDVLNAKKKEYPCINIIRRETNEGIGKALAVGLLETKNEVVMRMDSDDLCLPERAEIQLPLMERFDLIGGLISEFSGDEDNITGYRYVPETYEGIYKFAKKRNPFNHPTVMFRKTAILAAGNYQTLYYVEDYYLWVRVLLTTKKVYNVQTVLVNMRSGIEMRRRRKAKGYMRSVRKLRRFMLKNKMISPLRYCVLIFAQSLFISLNTGIQSSLYNRFLRRRKKAD